MAVEDKPLKLFTTRIRQMILHYQEVRRENSELNGHIKQQEETIAKLESQLKQAENDYNSLKMAKMLEITERDMDAAKIRLSKLIREVNKCITLLSEK